MSKNFYGENFVADSRYYHFTFVKASRGMNLSDYWRKLGSPIATRHTVDFQNENSTIQHRKIRSEIAFARGAVAEAMSEKGGGRPPYFYDLIAISTDISGETYFAFGFPFVGLGIDIIGRLVEGQNFMRSGQFVGADILKVISSAEDGRDQVDGMNSKIVGVQFIVTDDKSLTAIRLGGADPLSAQIYVGFLRKKVDAGVFLPDQCVLACEQEYQGEGSGSSGSVLRSRLHLAGQGHFKFYVHSGLSNLRLLPNALAKLKALNCFQRVYGNPLRKSVDDGNE